MRAGPNAAEWLLKDAGALPDDLLTNFFQNLNATDDSRFIPPEKHAARHLGQTEFGARHLIAAGLISHTPS